MVAVFAEAQGLQSQLHALPFVVLAQGRIRGRRFCSETVALAAIKDDEISGGGSFEADAMVRHHGPADIEGSRWSWSIAERSGKVVLGGGLGTHKMITDAVSLGGQPIAAIGELDVLLK